ncbi:hypothetical protein EOPP23_19610 [Endozoicomonas sp. OPT23]|uniref:hypothetical protein n=1 Tax=Endozoicomonas sp. OPT23 TaxID=2072845 RepID=UPI00129B1DBB|nr:hypothetical protein [Endozoicomonas sp. OPT23]MRI35178.1 hypothetical protein [Endozoicomonas sp. OPT23]
MKSNINASDLTRPGIIEYVTFPALPDIQDYEIINALEITDAVLNNIDGFIHRYCSQQDDGFWAETVFWRDREAAESGLKVFLADPRSQSLLQLIDSQNVVIRYSEVFAGNAGLSI